MARIKGTMEQIDKRLNHIETEISELRAEINTLRGEVNSNFKWTLGLLIPMWVSIIVTILLSSWG